MSNPYIKTVVLCAGPQCSHQRGAVNHWFVVLMDTHGAIPTFELTPWDQKMIDNSGDALPVCGEACAQKLLSEFMGKVKA